MPLSGTFLADLERIVGADGLVCSPEGRLVYECDMHTFYKGAPDAVALPTRADQVVAIVNLCRREHVPIVPRGSGTGLIGGAMAPIGGVMVGTNRMDGILEIDLPNRCATVQPGLINLPLTRAVSSHGYFFAPDPSSQIVSSIGGNVATNAGGPHCLKYGITTIHVLGLELVTGAGALVRLGGKAAEHPGYDLVGVAVGSEGTFGIVTAVTVRLLHAAEAVKTILASFTAIEDASEAVSAIIAAGIVPAALEMLDELMIRAINEGTGTGYPKDAAAVLLIELDGPAAEVEAQGERAARICWERGALDGRERGAVGRLHRDGGHGDWGARRRPRQGQESPAAVRRSGPELHVSLEARVRSRSDHESGQAAALAPGLRRGIPSRTTARARRHLDLAPRCPSRRARSVTPSSRSPVATWCATTPAPSMPRSSMGSAPAGWCVRCRSTR